MRLRFVVLWFVARCLIPVPASSSDDRDWLGVHLTRPDCLAGWEYGPERPSGWTVAAGTLRGNASSTPLLSGFTFGDFQLRFDWGVEGIAAWEVSLPEVPSGPGLRLRLCEGNRCGQIDDAGRTLAPGSPVAAVSGGLHRARLDRTAGRLTLTVDDRQLWQVPVAPDRRFGLGLAVIGGEARLADLRAQEPPGEPIFNGKDLTGWWTPGDIKAWAAENGQIVLRKENGNYLRTQKEYANYTLSLEYRIRKGGNSGIGIRTPRPAWPSGDGMEIQLWDIPYDNKPLDKHAAGAIYGNMPPLARADKSGQYNRMVIKADGWMISLWMNGELIQQCNTGDHPELKNRHLAGWIGIQDHGARTEVRNLRVLEAPPGLGLDAWQKPRPLCGARLVVDRLMNSERLSVPDGVRSGAVTARVEGNKADGHVLADLTGPGAVVCLARTSDDGRLAFYFDGEQKPRLESKPSDLWQSPAQLGEDPNPVLTYLAYRKGLRIVLRGAARGNWRIDYLTFPKNVPVETYTAGDPHAPRGWLAAALYRHEQFGWGVHREFEPRPRMTAKPKTIQPGKRERMIRLDGAGIVHWIKLAADKRVLDNNDLWLEVRTDGQKEPAIATPVRFWFPGLAGNGNYPNFVLVDRNGVTNMLAMPFGAGIELALSNRGTKPIRNVGMIISPELATEKTRSEFQNRMRLHAVFELAGKEPNHLASCRGRGRWVGLVCEQPKGTTTQIESLAVDGQTVESWSGWSLDTFLGRSGDFRSCLSGRHGPLAWRYLLVDPVDFQQSLDLTAAETRLGNRLAIFYGCM
jgi:hypothetical protein